MIKKIFIVLLIASCMLIVHTNAYARVTGNCANCHTMHNSQNGTAVASGGPYAVLLVNDCLGCHSSNTSSTYYTLGGCNVPVVLYTGEEPSTYLAGGNFWWVKEGLGADDTKGHNVFLDEPDNNLTIAPGYTMPQISCGDPTTSCHFTLSNTDTLLGTRQGCTKCHMMRDNSLKRHHHADDSNTVVGSEDGDEDAFYRFLQGHISGVMKGVSGIEDSDWQATNSSNDHNEYLGNPGTKTISANNSMATLGNTMTGFCCGCHGNFHWQKNVDAGPWIRHPSDAVIPNSGEYSAYTTYDLQVPVARPDLSDWTEPSDTITLDQDMVMCLSCHRPHGSPYPDMLRWDYSTMVAGEGGSGGCFTCHSQKNQAP